MVCIRNSRLTNNSSLEQNLPESGKPKLLPGHKVHQLILSTKSQIETSWKSFMVQEYNFERIEQKIKFGNRYFFK